MRRKASLAALLVAGVGVGVLLSGVLGHGVPSAAAAEKTATTSEKAVPVTPELRHLGEQLDSLFQAVATNASPGVVLIETEEKVTVTVPQLESPFEQFFGSPFESPGGPGRPQQRQMTRRALGSGCILDQEGYIVTNNHMVKGANTMKVTLPDGRSFDAKTVGTDPKTDLAIIRLQGKDVKDLPTVTLGDSDKVHIGQWVIAIGNPFGLRHTVSAGIISATGRTHIGVAEYESLLQTDAAINPGNSGGPLVNLDGEVVGINTAIVGRSGNVGIGFAIPINMFKQIRKYLMEGKAVVRGYLGIMLRDLTPEMAKRFQYEGTGGALVEDVVEDSPAAKAGMEAGDIITEFNGRKVDDVNSLRDRVAATPPDTEVEMKVWRKDKEATVKVTVGNLASAPEVSETDWLGVQVQTLTPQAAGEMGRPNLRGVVVTGVAEESPAARQLNEGDVILSVNRQKVRTAAEYRQLISKTDAETGVLLQIFDAQTGFTRFVLIQGQTQ